MEIMWFLIPMALILGAIFLALFIWSTKKGQYDDMDTPALRMLLDDKNINTNPNKDGK